MSRRRGGDTGGGPGSALLVTLLLLGTADASSAGLGQDPQAVRAFAVTASRFEFDPPLLEVNEGDLVRLTLRSTDTTHGFEIKELKVKMKIPKGGDPVSVDFVARRAGTFPIVCSEYCGSGHRRMKASLVVSPRSSQ